MAIFDVDFPEDFLSDLLDTEFDEIAEEALKEAAPLLESSMKQSCRRVIEHSGESRKYRVSNALKLIWKEYGVAGRQPARPFLTSACNAVRGAVMEKMQKVYERKTGMK